ncbi:transcription elongation factor SPT6 isoform X2 [Cynara cardunculus var. scolymus]|nr:transcription elongation factor SPT6 isoform X2 [Cynara cardunculus var. scolymus]
MSDKKKKKLKIKQRNKESTKEDGVCEYVPYSTKVGDDSNEQSDILDGANSIKKRKKVVRKKKIKGAELPEAETTETVRRDDDDEEGKNSSAGMSNKKKNKLKKKKRNKENTKVEGVCELVRHSNEAGDDSNQQSGKSKGATQLKDDASLLDEDEDEVYQISSGDEDETTGMKRWIAEYHRARPGAEVLLQRIDDFLVDYWEQKEKEREEREAEAAEGGWTVVKHIKGRKKTTDGESGTTMGSVAQAAVIDKMSKKKKDKQHVVGLNFYRFQRREAQRNEIMMLQTKFEQDKKRIQQMRAARKFRPY